MMINDFEECSEELNAGNAFMGNLKQKRKRK